jgi:nucleoside-diphosphate-sugar epimerase
MNKLHVIFGAGPAGQAIMQSLLAQGFQVRMVNRSGKGTFPKAVERMSGDVRDPEFVRRAIAGAGVAYQTLNAPYHRWAEDFPPLQAGLLSGMKGSGVRLVVLENVYLYGDTGGQPMRESSPIQPSSRKGLVRAQMAADLLTAHQGGEVEVVIGRAADFVGPKVRQSAMGERTIPVLLAGKKVSLMGDPDQVHSFNYLPDLGKAMVRLGQEPSAFGRAWHLPCPPLLSTRQVLQAFADYAERPLKTRIMSPWLMKTLGLFIPEVRELPEMLYQWTQPFVLDDSRIRAAFGLEASSWETIVAETVDWWRHDKEKMTEGRSPTFLRQK